MRKAVLKYEMYVYYLICYLNMVHVCNAVNNSTICKPNTVKIVWCSIIENYLQGANVIFFTLFNGFSGGEVGHIKNDIR